MLSFKDKKVLVTGGSTGIGLEIIRILLNKGAIVHSISRTEPPIKNSNLHVYLSDLYLEMPKIDNFYDIVMLNIGVNPGQKNFDDFTIEEMNRTIYLNLTVHLMILKTVKYNKVVFLDSVLSMIGLPNNSIYCACKSFISIFNESLRQEGKDTYIIYPYKVNTELFTEIKDFILTLDKKYVAETIIKDIENGRKTRVLPWIFTLVPLLKAILPTFILDFIAKLALKMLTKPKSD